jgi:hypothetical protein
MVGFLLAGTVAKADPLSITLASPYQSGWPGDTLVFIATVTNNDPTEVVWLNSDGASIVPPNLKVDDIPFFTNFPFFLNPGDSVTAELFDVYIPDGVPIGLYTGSFEILGGDPSDFTDEVGYANYNIDALPEPSSYLLFGTGLALLAGIIRRRLIQSPAQH